MTTELPRALAHWLDELLAGTSPRELRRSVSELSARYRSRQHAAPGDFRESDARAYAAYRLPATYAAVASAMTAVAEQLPDWRPRTVLDLGAGLGSGMWAAVQTWPSIERVHAVDAAAQMLALARAAAQPARPAEEVTWEAADLRDWRPSTTYDLVVLAYVLGELSAQEREGVLARAWAATRKLVLVVEPGTPDGYRRVIEARSRLLDAGAATTAPCPHDSVCPMSGGDWCHFSARLPRSARHRAAKGAELGYEDEKFSYVAASGGNTPRTNARILRHPQVRPGHVYLELCTTSGLRTALVAKRDKEAFRRARKASWGDAFDDAGVSGDARSELELGPPTAPG